MRRFQREGCGKSGSKKWSQVLGLSTTMKYDCYWRPLGNFYGFAPTRRLYWASLAYTWGYGHCYFHTEEVIYWDFFWKASVWFILIHKEEYFWVRPIITAGQHSLLEEPHDFSRISDGTHRHICKLYNNWVILWLAQKYWIY